MKINWKKPAHWIYLACFVANVVVGLVARAWGKRTNTVVLYGHKFHGNLKPIYEHLSRDSGVRVVYLTVSPAYYRQLRRAGVTVHLALNPWHMIAACRARAVVSDHGLHALYLLLVLSDMKFFDVWHGIPFKGFDEDDFRVQQRYRATLVTSPSMKSVYVNRYGFSEDRVFVTGYARTDRLVQERPGKHLLLRKYGLDGGRPIILVAPTWHHEKGRDGALGTHFEVNALVHTLDSCATTHDWLVIVRQHLNSRLAPRMDEGRVRFMSLDDYPETEDLLLLSDVLVTDWSSIAFDYLLLRRPTVFLDTPAPFAKGFSYGPEYRYGKVVADMDALTSALQWGCLDRDGFLAVHGEKMLAVRAELYGSYADGGATQRCVETILELSESGDSMPTRIATLPGNTAREID